jgi:FKBP-type peptidyl-prolyl cis-trans isomerase (trigger factor)
MENQELKSVSNPIGDSEEVVIPEVVSSVSVFPLAQQYQAVVKVPSDELQTRFDSFWDEHFDVLMKKFGRGFKKGKGGKVDPKAVRKSLEKTIKVNKLYHSVIVGAFVEQIDKYVGKSDSILHITSINLSGSNPESGEDVIIGSFYYREELELKNDLNYSLDRVPRKNWDDVWVEKVDYICNKHRILTTCEDDVEITDKHRVLLDVHTSVNDKPYEDLNYKLEWFDVGKMSVAAFKGGVCSHKKGDLFDLSYVVEGGEGEEDSEVKSKVKIHEVQSITYPEFDDALVHKHTNTEQTVTEFRLREEEKYKDYIEYMDSSMALQHITDEIVHNSIIPPAPNEWVKYMATNVMQDHIAQNKGNEERAMQALGVSDTGEMLSVFCDRVHSDYIRQLALRKFSSMHNVDPQNADAMKDAVLKAIEWKDPDND